jgi:hypothetical protein
MIERLIQHLIGNMIQDDTTLDRKIDLNIPLIFQIGSLMGAYKM